MVAVFLVTNHPTYIWWTHPPALGTAGESAMAAHLDQR